MCGVGRGRWFSSQCRRLSVSSWKHRVYANGSVLWTQILWMGCHNRMYLCLLIGKCNFLLAHSLFVGMLRTPLRAETCYCCLCRELVTTPLTNLLNFNVCTHIIRVDFSKICIVAYPSVPWRTTISTTLLKLGVELVNDVQYSYK